MELTKTWKMKIILLCLFLSCRLITLAQWSNVGSTSISNAWTTYNDIAIDTSGAPVVIFNESPSTLKCMKYNGVQWQDVGLSTFNFPWGGNTQLIVDSVYNTHYISYSDVNTNYTSIIKYNGSIWSYVGNQFIVNESVNDFVMAIDNTGILYCAFISSSGFQLFKENANAWQQITTSGLVTPISNIAITFDLQNNLLLAFTNMNNLSASCMKLNGTVWQQIGNSNITSGAFAQYNKIKVSETNEIYFATQNINTCCYKLNSSNIWQQLGVSGLGFNYIGIDDLIIDKNNQPYIITSQIASDKANCVYFNGSSWVKSCGNSISDTTASSVAMEINAQSVIYAIFNDFAEGKAFVRKCVSVNSINDLENNISFKIYPNPFKDEATMQTDYHLKNATLTVVNYFEQTIKQINNISGQTVTISRGNLASGLYFVRLTEENKLLITKKIVITD